MHHMGALGCHMGGLCHCIEAKCTGWEQCTLDWSHMVPFGSMGAVLPHVRAMYNRMGAVMPYGSNMMPFAPSGAGWEPWGWGGSQEAMYTFGSIAAHLLPHWALLWQRNAGVGLAAGSYRSVQGVCCGRASGWISGVLAAKSTHWPPLPTIGSGKRIPAVIPAVKARGRDETK
jgi:hypothetical protein